MTKSKFLDILYNELSTLPHEERLAAVQYYTDYFNDAEQSEAGILQELGSPYDVASRILSEYDIPHESPILKETQSTRVDAPVKKSIPTWGIVLLALAFPIWIPLFLVIGIIVLSLGLGLFILTLAFFFAGLFLIFTSMAVFTFAFTQIFFAPSIAVYYIGKALWILGIGGLFSGGIVFILLAIFRRRKQKRVYAQ